MLKLLLDENLRSGALWQALGTWRETMGDAYPLDILRVGDLGAPPLGTKDLDLLEVAAAAGRVLISEDRSTLPSHLQTHLQKGPSPGIIILRTGLTVPQIVELLAMIAYAADEEEFANQSRWIP